MNDNELIEFLGGPAAVRKQIQAETGHSLTIQAVIHWRKRGIPVSWRHLLGTLARRKERKTRGV